MTTLNFDILVLVFDHLTPLEILHFSTVSQAVYATALHKALSSIRIETQLQLHQTCTFIFANSSLRSPLVRTLTIACSSFYEGNVIQKTCAHDIWRLLSHTTNLQHLLVERVDRLLRVEPRVKDAIAAFEHLETLEYTKIDSDTLGAGLTSNLRSKPRKIIFDSSE